MDVNQINACLLRGDLDAPGLFPHVEGLADAAVRFRFDFGLDELPEQPGLILVRGARQYGKSTWLEQKLKDTAERFGPGSALYLNGDELGAADALAREVRRVVPAFDPDKPVARLFIDEITAVRDWTRGMKRLFDAGELRRVLVITTGSRAADLRHGAERLPGRKGKLDRTTYLFAPISFAEFRRACGDRLGVDLLPAYLVSGGSPIALASLAEHGRILEHVVELTRDWIYGECAAGGRSRASLLATLGVLLRHAGSPVGQSKLAREAGLANNTVAAGYVDLLMDLLFVGECVPWDADRKAEVPRRPAKYPILNLLCATSFHAKRPRSAADYRALDATEQGGWLEWAVAQELWRRRAILGHEMPERMHFWQGGGHELDYVVSDTDCVEVKRGRVDPLEFTWFPRSFPKARLTVVNAERFRAQRVDGVTLEDFLLDEEWRSA